VDRVANSTNAARRIHVITPRRVFIDLNDDCHAFCLRPLINGTTAAKDHRRPAV